MPLKRKHDPGYKLPEVIDPEQTCCICIPIPNDFNHKMAFLGQLDELGYWWNWEKDPLKQGREAATVWRKIVACIREDMNMSDCGCSGDRIPTNQRYTEDGHLEVSYDNGASWENADDIDPRFNSPIFPPLPGADGASKRCKGANSVVAILKDEQAKSSAILDAATGLAALITAVAGYVASTGVGIVIGVVIALMSAVLTAIINAGETTFTASFGGTTWDDLLCILYCEIEDDGSFTEQGWTNVVAQANTLPNYPANEWLAHMIRVIGTAGLTNASLTGVAGSMSCDGCECGCSEGCTPLVTTYQYTDAAWITHGAYTRYSAGTPVGQFDSFTLATPTAVLDLGSEVCVTAISLTVNNACPAGEAAAIDCFVEGVLQSPEIPIDRVGCGASVSCTWTFPVGILANQLSFVQAGSPCAGGHDNYLICAKITTCV